MPDGNGFFPPVGYSPVWNLVALGIVLGLAAFYVGVYFLTRQRKAQEPPEPGTDSAEPTLDLQERYLHPHRRGARSSHAR